MDGSSPSPTAKWEPIMALVSTDGESNKWANWNNPSGSPEKSLSIITRILGDVWMLVSLVWPAPVITHRDNNRQLNIDFIMDFGRM